MLLPIFYQLFVTIYFILLKLIYELGLHPGFPTLEWDNCVRFGKGQFLAVRMGQKSQAFPTQTVQCW